MTRHHIREDLANIRHKIHFPTLDFKKLHIETKLRSTPDWLRRGIRLSLALILFGLLGHAISFPPTWGTNLQSEVKQACNWASITCIVSDTH